MGKPDYLLYQVVVFKTALKKEALKEKVRDHSKLEGFAKKAREEDMRMLREKYRGSGIIPTPMSWQNGNVHESQEKPDIFSVSRVVDGWQSHSYDIYFTSNGSVWTKNGNSDHLAGILIAEDIVFAVEYLKFDDEAEAIQTLQVSDTG